MNERFVAYQMENSEYRRAMDRHYYLDCSFEKNIHGNPELVYVTEGEVDVDIDGERMVIPSGNFCLILPWQVHSFSTRKHSNAVIIVFSPRYIHSFVQEMEGKAGKKQVFSACEEICSLFLKYLYEGPFPDEYMTSSILLGLCHEYVRQCPRIPRYKNARSSGLDDVMYYITKHCGERLTLKDVAAATGYSYYHLSHLFRENAGMSFTRFLNMTRTGRAAERLQNTEDPMTDIAFECGFSSVRNFNRVFGEMMEMTPSEYRAQHKQMAESGQRTKIWGEQVKNVK